MVWTPESEPPVRSEGPTDAAPTARQWLEGAAAPSAPAMAAAGPSAQSREDDSWTPARPLTPDERVLIWDRIDANRRSTAVFFVLFVLFTAAFFAAIGVFVTLYAGVPEEDQLMRSVQFAVVAVLIAMAFGIMMYFSASATVLMVSGAHEVSKEGEPELYRVVENLCIGCGLPMPRVWVIEDSAPNAFATGRDPQRASVAVTRGLLDKLEKRELEGVIAHELSHVGNYDVRLMTLLAVAVGLIALIADLMLRFTWYGAGARSSNRGRGGGAVALVLLVVAILFIILAPIVGTVMKLAISRRREYLADASGALLCRNPDALADALEKIAADKEPLEAANKATAHLYISNPLHEHGSFLNNLFSTHPPIEERVRLLRAMA
jgi:heat shock protein HtpX